MYTGVLRKMSTEAASPIQYTMRLGQEDLVVNDWVGKAVKLRATGNNFCIDCGNATTNRFGQGFCYSCFMESPLNSECIVRPELCRAHLGQGRDVEWEEAYHNQPHVVYLADSGGLKVGVTSDQQIPYRWIDQGATQGVVIAETPNRYLAGSIEVTLKQFYDDKTHWQRMLRGAEAKIDLDKERSRAHSLLPEDLQAYRSSTHMVRGLQYPLERPPATLKSVNLEKENSVSGRLVGVRGQYLVWEHGQVMNVRKHSGMEIVWEAGQPQPVQTSLF